MPIPLPERMLALISLMEGLSERERREMLESFAQQVPKWSPLPDHLYDVVDVRKDKECIDTVGIYLNVTPSQEAEFRVSLGPKVQTLTRALTVLLCDSFHQAPVSKILNVPHEVIAKLIGTVLFRMRSHTVYYVLDRMKLALRMHPIVSHEGSSMNIRREKIDPFPCTND